MGALLAGIVCLLLAFLLPLPYVLYIILIVAGAILVIYGLWLIFVGGGPRTYFVRRR